jgi:glycosyltransferase involved in cell wall biosynthesis
MSDRVSVIMPCRDAGRFIDAALESVWRQERPVHEVVVVDCASSDDSAEVAGRHRAAGHPVRLVAAGPLTPAAARNVALTEAAGDLIAFLDADDLWPAGKLSRQLDRLSRAPHVDMVSGYVRYFETADGSGLEPAANSRTETIFHVHLGACIYRRETLDKLGGRFDEALLYGEDVDLMLRVREAAVPFTILRSVELFYRRHAASLMAADNPRQQADFRLATHKSILRRRAGGTLATPLRDFASFVEQA